MCTKRAGGPYLHVPTCEVGDSSRLTTSVLAPHWQIEFTPALQYLQVHVGLHAYSHSNKYLMIDSNGGKAYRDDISLHVL